MMTRKYVRVGVMLLCVVASHLNLQSQPCREVVAYYPNWQWYDRAKLVDPFSLKYQGYTVINYAFFKPEANGAISSTDSWADENLLLGEINWSTTPPSYYPNTSLVERAHSAGVKVLASIGGWTMSANFPGIAANQAKRSLFASECNRLISTYDFDGIDIDWEYPGYAPNGGTPADKGNFTLLMQLIRDSLDALGLQSGKSFLLTSCFGANADNATQIEWGNVIPVIDMFNLMTYDFFGPWDCTANHNAPLYAPGAGDPEFNLHATYQRITVQYGVPASKVNIGIAFYGRSQVNGPSLYGPTGCNPDNQTFPEDDGAPLYYNIAKNMAMFSKHWDTLAMVPYLVGLPSPPAAYTFVSYDDEASVALKAQYVIDHQARGVIIWEATGDYMETFPGSGILSSNPLLDTINQVLCNGTKTPEADFARDNPLLTSLYPQPASETVHLRISMHHAGSLAITITDARGTVALERAYSLSEGDHALDLPVHDLPAGCYFLHIRGTNQNTTAKLLVVNH